MESPVERVIVFGLAMRAHFEGRHGGVLAVIRNAPDDGEPGAAISAVDEGIKVAAVGGVEHFAKAVIAGCNVWRDECVGW